MKWTARLAIFTVFGGVSALLPACGPMERQATRLQADGWYGADRMPQITLESINSACGDPRGAAEAGVSYDECRLIIAGAAVRESSWDVNKSCEAWGDGNDPACGLTQSRWMDARAVGLDCSPSEQSTNGYKCNALTGFRNLRCKADGGTSCDRWGGGRTLHTGIKKHLGPNQGAFESYRYDMETVYNREDIRQKLYITGSVRSWYELLNAPQ